MAVKTFRGFDGGLTDFHIDAPTNKMQRGDNLVLDEYNNLISRPGFTWANDIGYYLNSTSGANPAAKIHKLFGLETANTFGIGLIGGQRMFSQDFAFSGTTEMFGLIGASPNQPFAGTNVQPTSTTLFNTTQWNKQTYIAHTEPLQRPLKTFLTGSTRRVMTMGLPKPASSYTATGGAGASYIYALVLAHTYTVGSDLTFTVRSAPRLKSFSGIGTATPSSSPGITVGSIPTFTGDHNNGIYYVDSELKVEIYRTTNAGTTLFYVGEVTNGTTTFADTVSDNTLITNRTLYTAAGELGNDRPPRARYVHATGDFCFFAGGFEVGVDSQDLALLGQRVWQSKRGAPDHVPASFYADIEDVITGLSSIKGVPVVFGQRSTYRLDGNFDNFGRGGIIPRKISDSIGCLNNNSIVPTNNGLFFAGNDGFYFTDGYTVTLVSPDIKDTYRLITNSQAKRNVINGTLDTKENRILWATADTVDHEDTLARKIFCYDIEKGAFTTWSSGYKMGAPTLAQSVTFVSNPNANETLLSTADTTGLEVGMFMRLQNGATEFEAFRSVSSSASNIPYRYVTEIVSATEFKVSPQFLTGTNDVFFLPNNVNSIFYRNFNPCSVYFRDGDNLTYFGTNDGRFLRFDDSLASDIMVYDNQIQRPILYDYRGPASALGSTEYRKWVNSVVIKAKPRIDLSSELSILPRGENDNTGQPHDLEYVVFSQFYPWGTPQVPYGDPRLYQKRAALMDVKRRFPAGKLRCEYKQMQIQNAFAIKYRSRNFSDLTATSFGSSAMKTLTFTDLSQVFPTDIVDYYIYFESDNYTRGYRIRNRSTTAINVVDEDNSIALGLTGDWIIRGYIKNSLIRLIEYSLYYEILGDSQQPYGGENKAN